MLRNIVIVILSVCSLTAVAENDSIPRQRTFGRKVLDGVVGVLKEFNNFDTTYIEPQHYKFTASLMSTYSFEQYSIRSKSGQEVTFAPESRFKVGPYIGWSLLFWGYTFDLGYIPSKTRRQLSLSGYTTMLGFDFFWRRTGGEYMIRSWNSGSDKATELGGVPFEGLDVSITGLNVYYIFNHRKFSYPAAFNQSTCQRKSAGSLMLGAGYTRHSLHLDHRKLQETLDDAMPDITVEVDSGMMFDKIKYTDLSLSLGYGYNWVFARNWLFSASLSAAIGYKHSSGSSAKGLPLFNDLSLSNFNVDGVGRVGFIWNDSKWYFGSYGVVHTYNYSKSQFKTNNYFGNVYVYVGVNFGRKKSHKQQ